MGKGKMLYIAKVSVIAIMVNLLLSVLLNPHATEEEKVPMNGLENLSVKGQMMHQMVHNSKVPLSSNLYLVFIIGVSIYLACFIKM